MQPLFRRAATRTPEPVAPQSQEAQVSPRKSSSESLDSSACSKSDDEHFDISKATSMSWPLAALVKKKGPLFSPELKIKKTFASVMPRRNSTGSLDGGSGPRSQRQSRRITIGDSGLEFSMMLPRNGRLYSLPTPAVASKSAREARMKQKQEDSLQELCTLSPLERGSPQIKPQTVIIFDWDDTLFPTTWVCSDNELPWHEPCPDQDSYTQPLASLASVLEEVLDSATFLADRVAIVTLARPPWVDVCMENFYGSNPALRDSMQNIQVIYARDGVKEDKSGAYDRNNFSEAADYWSALKFRAIREQCRLATQRDPKCGDDVKPGLPGICGANLISIGDSLFEKAGTLQASDDWSEEHFPHAERLPRTKTIKLLDEPTAEELETELTLILNWLPDAVSRDASFHLDFTQVGEVVSGDLESAITNDGWDFPPGEARADALLQGRFWKPKVNESVQECWHWEPRQMWLSRSGKLWYEGMTLKKPVTNFSGMPLGKMTVRFARKGEAVDKIQDIEVYPIAFIFPEGETHYLAVESNRARRSFIKASDIFSRCSAEHPPFTPLTV